MKSLILYGSIALAFAGVLVLSYESKKFMDRLTLKQPKPPRTKKPANWNEFDGWEESPEIQRLVGYGQA